jgi:hypothetical protein
MCIICKTANIIISIYKVSFFFNDTFFLLIFKTIIKFNLKLSLDNPTFNMHLFNNYLRRAFNTLPERLDTKCYRTNSFIDNS